MFINTCFLFQEHLSVCAGWGVGGTFLSSLEMSVKYSSVVSLRDCPLKLNFILKLDPAVQMFAPLPLVPTEGSAFS